MVMRGEEEGRGMGRNNGGIIGGRLGIARRMAGRGWREGMALLGRINWWRKEGG